MAATIEVELGVFVKLFACEQVGGALAIGVLFESGLTKREVFHVLEYFAVDVGDVARQSKVILLSYLCLTVLRNV